MKKIFLVSLCLIVVCLSGCSRHDEVYYLHHPDSLKVILDHCAYVRPTQKSQREECLISMRIYEKLSGLSQTMMANPQGFGKQIIVLQSQQAKIGEQMDVLNARLQDAKLSTEQKSAVSKKISALKKTFDANKKELKIRLALVAAAEGM